MRKCFISCSACWDDARAVAALIEERFKKLNGRVMINSVGTVIGSHTGRALWPCSSLATSARTKASKQNS